MFMSEATGERGGRSFPSLPSVSSPPERGCSLFSRVCVPRGGCVRMLSGAPGGSSLPLKVGNYMSQRVFCSDLPR
jgi:hypothetical protein